MSISKNNVIICPPTKRSIRKISKIVGNNNFKWVYLGEDVANAIAVEKSIGQRGERIDISDTLQETARSLRQPYIDYIGKLSVEHNSMLWWAGSLSEKNPFISKTFLYSCYVKVALSLFESHKRDNLILFVENRALGLSLVKNISEISEISEYDMIRLEPKFSHVLESLTDRMEFTIKHWWFVINNIYRILLTQHLYHLNEIKNESKDDLFLIHTWVDQRSFPNGNGFHDAYFKLLSKHVKGKGKNVGIVPYILHTVSYAQTVKKLIACNDQFFVQSAYLKISDIVQVLKATAKKPIKNNYPYFENIDISSIIYNDFINDWKNTRLVSNLLFYYMVKNWKEQDIAIERFIYTYENHTWEKILCIAFRKYYPSTRLIGYQHSHLPLMLLNYFFSHVERDIIPFPDKVITNGRYSKNLLINSCYDVSKVQCGGAIRYATLLSNLKNNDENDRINNKELPIIVVTPAIGKNEAMEFVWKIVNSTEFLGACKIIIKCHPLMPFNHFSKNLPVKKLPENISIVETPINELLKEADILLYTTSTTAIEAFADAVPVIHVKSDYIIDKDSLDFDYHLRKSVSHPRDIASCIKNILKKHAEIKKCLDNKKDMLSDVFTEVDDHVYDLFINKT